MADDQEDEASRLLKKILSPAEAQSLVLPPPDPCAGKRPGRVHSADRQPGQTAFAGHPFKAECAGPPRPGRIFRRSPARHCLIAAAIRST